VLTSGHFFFFQKGRIGDPFVFDVALSSASLYINTQTWKIAVDRRLKNVQPDSSGGQMRKHLLLFATVFVFLQATYAQDSLRAKPAYLHSGKIGLGVDGITGSPNLLLKYFFNNQLAMQVIVGLDLDVPGGTTPQNYTKVTGMAIRGGLSIIYHLTQDQVSPYVGVEGIYQHEKTAGFFLIPLDPKNSFIGSGVLGAEFFINERFTLGIKHNLGMSVQLKRDLPKEETTIKFNTATLVTGRFYFN
jgi:outer membrane protein W